MKVLALVLTAVMFGSIACESPPEPQPDTIVAAKHICIQQVTPSDRNEYWGTLCNYRNRFYGGREVKVGEPIQNYDHYWRITVKTAQGTTYTVDVDYSLNPQIGDTWP